MLVLNIDETKFCTFSPKNFSSCIFKYELYDIFQTMNMEFTKIDLKESTLFIDSSPSWLKGRKRLFYGLYFRNRNTIMCDEYFERLSWIIKRSQQVLYLRNFTWKYIWGNGCWRVVKWWVHKRLPKGILTLLP